MLFFVIVALCFAALTRLFLAGGAAALLVYACLSARVAPSRWLRRHFAPRWLRAAFGGLHRDSALRRLARRAGRRQYVFAFAPHGPAADGLVSAMACHGARRAGRLQRMLDNTCVVAHSVYLALPLVRDIYTAFGVVPHRRSDVESALARGAHIALCPGGVAAMMRCIATPCADVDTVVVYRRRRAGFCALAARRGAHVVPVLVLGTARSWRCLGASFLPPLLAVHVKTREPVRCVFGAPIAAAAYASDVDALADKYYAALRRLGAKHGVRVLVERIET